MPETKKHGTAIEWTHGVGFKGETWNPVTGCSKVSPGCAHCYAETLALTRLAGKRGYPGLPWTPENAAENVMLRPERLDQPLKWRRPRMVFVNSMSDLFHEEVPDSFIAAVWTRMAWAQQHIFQILTKRPERMAELVPHLAILSGDWLPNVWLGVSIENRRYVHRADILRKTPAAVRFISAEPLLGPLVPYLIDFGSHRHLDRHACAEHGCDLEALWKLGDDTLCDDHARRFGLDLTDIDWLIVGGESGPDHRPVRAEWVRDLRDACLEQRLWEPGTGPDPDGPRTRFFFKQWGGRTPKAGGRLLDGRVWDEMLAAVS